MVKRKYKLTVIIPVYNQEELLKRALESVPDECEIIVVDDGSTDNTMETAVRFQLTHPNVKVPYNVNNKGVGSAINKGLDLASGDYVVLLGSDDYFYTDALRTVMEHMNGDDLIYFDLLTNEGEIFHLSPSTKKTFCGSVKLMRRNFIGSTRNKTDVKYGEDCYFYNELLKKNPTESFTDIVAKHYNFPRKGSLSDQMRKDNQNEN